MTKGTAFRKFSLVEADGLALIPLPETDPLEMAVVLQHKQTGLRLYYAMDPGQVRDIAIALLTSIDEELLVDILEEVTGE